jgi:hypothetical protein
LAFLRTIDTTETDAFRVLVVQDFDGVTVEDGDNGAGIICRKNTTGEKDAKACANSKTMRNGSRNNCPLGTMP